MAKIEKSMPIIIRKTSTCAAGNKVLEMLDSLKDGQTLKIKSILGDKKVNGMWPVYIDDTLRANIYGLIKKGSVEDDYIESLVKNKNYEIVLNGHEGNEMSATLNQLFIEGAAVQKTTDEFTSEISELVKNIVERGIATKEEMDERLAVFKENGVDGLLIARILKKYRKYKRPVRRPSTIYKDPYMDDCSSEEEGLVAEGLRAVADGTAIIAEGEKSLGKNVYLETIAWLAGKPIYLITFSRQMSPSSVYGEKTTDPSAAKELAEFDSSILATADRVEEKIKFSMNLLFKQGIGVTEAQEIVMDSLSEEEKAALNSAAEFRKLQAQSASVNIVIDQSEMYDWLDDGGVMIFNELNMCDANFLASFANQLLDGTGFLFFPGRGNVKIHEDCVLFATQNAEYQGTEQQNEATMSRFGCFVFHRPASIKKQIVAATEAAIKKSDFPDVKLEDKYFTQCQNFYLQCRKSVESQTVSSACLNIRGFVRALKSVATSNGRAKLKRQLEIHVINTCPSDDRLALSSALSEIVTL